MDIDREVAQMMGVDPKVTWIATTNGGKSALASTSRDGPWYHKEQIEEWIKEHPVVLGDPVSLASWDRYPPYSTDIGAAWAVVEKLLGPCNGHLMGGISRGFESEGGPVRWCCTFPGGKTCWADTAPMCIALAALESGKR